MSLYSGRGVQRSWKFVCRNKVGLSIASLLVLSGTGAVVAQNPAKDPGVRAGSVDSAERVRTLSELGVWAFTIGTAALDLRLVPGAPLADQLSEALATAA